MMQLNCFFVCCLDEELGIDTASGVSTCQRQDENTDKTGGTTDQVSLMLQLN